MVSRNWGGSFRNWFGFALESPLGASWYNSSTSTHVSSCLITWQCNVDLDNHRDLRSFFCIMLTKCLIADQTKCKREREQPVVGQHVIAIMPSETITQGHCFFTLIGFGKFSEHHAPSMPRFHHHSQLVVLLGPLRPPPR